MLVLKRKAGEIIYLRDQNGDEVEFKVIEISEGRVKIGIDAPKSVSIFRKEVLEETKEANKESMNKINPKDRDKLKNLIKK